MMRSLKIYGICQGGSEQWVDTVSSASAGKAVRDEIQAQGRYDEIVVRDCVGGFCFRETVDKSAA